MNNHVFQCHGESPDKQQFTKTIEALSGHINKTMDFPKDVASICKNFTTDMIEEPKDLTAAEKESDTKKLIWKTKVQTYVRRIEAREKNYQRIFAVIRGQCSNAMKNKLKSLSKYESKSDSNDCV